MLIIGAIIKWKQAHHGSRVQAKAIQFFYAKIDDDFEIYLQPIFIDCKKEAPPDVHVDTLRR